VVALVARPTTAGWVYSLAAVLVAWAYARAMRAGLWAARLLIPALGGLAGATTGLPGGIWIAASGIALGLIAFHPGAALATRQLLPPPRPTPPPLMR